MNELVTIVGAGPVGLFLALRLASLGIHPRVLERRGEDHGGSRSIGIHPPSLDRLHELGLADALIERGVRVRRGLAFLGREPLGTLDLATSPRFPFVLSVPQHLTEELLRAALLARRPDALWTQVEACAVDARRGEVDVRSARGRQLLTSELVVACDGRHSALRRSAAIDFRGKAYGGEYLMCDAPDSTDLGSDAAVFLHADGLTESFPLPEGRRRWVIRRTPGATGAADRDELVHAVRDRTGHDVPRAGMGAPSAFAAERYQAKHLAEGRLALAGDAAHIVSPIGGQGMNVGWLGAWSLGQALFDVLSGAPGSAEALTTDAVRRSRLAASAARRAELNMWIGRPGASSLRAALVRALLSGRLAPTLARRFTMQGLCCDAPGASPLGSRQPRRLRPTSEAVRGVA